MATLKFGTAIVIFINLWLIALTAFGASAAAVFLYILDAVDNTIQSCVVMSLISASLSFTYPILQSLNVNNIKLRHWHKSWLSSTCLYLLRILIVSWVVTTTIGLVVALRQPLCRNGNVKTDATAWQAGLGCWIFRVLVSLNIVLLILTFSIFMLLEINGRYITIGLFHFEFSISDRHEPCKGHRRRRTLVASAYGDSVESLASPVTINSDDQRTLTNSAEKIHNSTTNIKAYNISPSPSYYSFDLLPSQNPSKLVPNSCSEASDETSTIAPSSSRHSISTTTTLATLPLSHFNPTTPDCIFASSQLQSRPLSMSDIPALPMPFKKQLSGTAINKDIPPIPTLQQANRPTLYNITNTSSAKLKSSCALPLSSTMTSLPQVETIEKPPPAWCPRFLKTAPLSADPAIKRLTELRRYSATSGRISRRASLSSFEFGFGYGFTAQRQLRDQDAPATSSACSAALNDLDTNTTPNPKKLNSDSSSAKTKTRPTKRRSSSHARGRGSFSVMPPPPPPIPDRAPGRVHARRGSSSSAVTSASSFADPWGGSIHGEMTLPR